MKHTNVAAIIIAAAVLVTAYWPASSSAQTSSHWRLETGPLNLDIYVSKTAHLFHVVDQISQWSEFCHRQYVSYFDQLADGLSKEDRELLAQHAAIRKAHGWGGGLEQTFYTPLDLESALAQGVKAGRLTTQEAQTERRILTHFQPRVEQLMSVEAPTLQRFVQQLSQQRSNLTVFAKDISRFVGGAEVVVPFYLIANPDRSHIGGGYNGGRLTLEIAAARDTYPMLLHELFHAFLRTKRDLIENAGRSVPGLDPETLSEGLAYAYNPGILHAGGADQLLADVAGYMGRGSSMKDSYTRFNFYGLALRPLLQEALSNRWQTLESFLPRATDAWLVLTELDKARATTSASQAHDYRKDPRHSIFTFGRIANNEEEANALVRLLIESTDRHYFGRLHAADQYQAMLTNYAKPGDTIVLLLSLDDDKARVPAEFCDLLPSAWTEIESRLKQGETVFTQSKARDMTMFLLAAPTVEGLRKEFRRCVAEKRFSP